MTNESVKPVDEEGVESATVKESAEAMSGSVSDVELEHVKRVAETVLASQRKEAASLEEALNRLVAMAQESVHGAYCPYSEFPVGAAVWARRPDAKGAHSKKFFAGCNIENSNHSQTLHAEQVAVAEAVKKGYTEILAVAVYTPTPTPTPPCGACLQMLQEFQSGTVVVSACEAPMWGRWKLQQLYPHPFELSGCRDK